MVHPACFGQFFEGLHVDERRIPPVIIRRQRVLEGLPILLRSIVQLIPIVRGW